MPFLPEGTEIPKNPSNYMKFSEPENKFRVLGSAITGYELWINGKPVRRKENKWLVSEYDNADINKFTGEKKTTQYFWAFPVYDYQTEKIEILEVTQKSIINGIKNYLDDEDFGGDPQKYDFVVKRQEIDKKVTYSVMAKPPRDIDPAITKLYEDMHIDVKQLYVGGDPFNPDKTTVSEQVADDVEAALG